MCREEEPGSLGRSAADSTCLAQRGGRFVRGGGGLGREGESQGVKMRASSQAVLGLSLCTPVSWSDLGNHLSLLPRFLHLKKGFGIAPPQGCW